MASPDGSVFRWAAIGFSPIRYIGSTVFAETGARRKGSESRGPFATSVAARGDVLVNSRRGSKAVMRRPAKPLRSVRLRLAPPGLFRCGHSPRIASRAVRLRAAVERDVDVCRRARRGGFYSLCISLLIDCRALAGPARARGRRARRGRIDIPSTSVSGRHRTRFAECAAGGGFAGASEAAMSAHRAIVRCRARQRPRPFPRARGATGGAATSRRAGFGRASRAQAGVTSARSK